MLNKEIKEETSIIIKKEQPIEVGGWNFTGNFCGEKHNGYTKLYKIDVYLTNLELLEILKYRSDEIEQVLFVERDFVINNPVKKINDKIVCPTIGLNNGKMCDISPHHLLPIMKFLNMDIKDLVPSYIQNYVVNF